MQKEKFISLLASPFPVNEKTVDEVREITEMFPYFQTAQILYAKLLKESHNIHFDSQLKVAAAYAADRKKLYELIEKTFPDKVLENVGLSPNPSEGEGESYPAKSRTEPFFPNAEILPVVNYNIEDYLSAAEISIDKHKTIEVFEPEKKPELKPKEEITAGFTGHEHEAHSFLKWLSYSKPIIQETKTEDTEETIPAETSVPVKEIIDKFIEEQPRIAPAKAAFYSPVNMARQSVEEQDDLVSPTLAQIYLAQGNSQKAIETYQRLILLYPEKSAFFAAQIEKIARA